MTSLCFYAFPFFTEHVERELNAAPSVQVGKGGCLCLASAPTARTQAPVCDGCYKHGCRGHLLAVSWLLFHLGLLGIARDGAAALAEDMRNCSLPWAALRGKYFAGYRHNLPKEQELACSSQSLKPVVLTQQDSEVLL